MSSSKRIFETAKFMPSKKGVKPEKRFNLSNNLDEKGEKGYNALRITGIDATKRNGFLAHWHELIHLLQRIERREGRRNA